MTSEHQTPESSSSLSSAATPRGRLILVCRQVVALTLLVLIVLQNAVAGYAMNLGAATGTSHALSSLCSADSALRSDDPALPSDDECCKHHTRQSMPLSCLAHCAAILAIVPAFTGFDAAKSHSFPARALSPWTSGEHSGPAFRPPIAS